MDAVSPERSVEARDGESLMTVAVHAGIDEIEGECGGEMSCATCHVWVGKEMFLDKLPDDVLWYHADYVAPVWGRRLSRVDKIGAHIFYRA